MKPVIDDTSFGTITINGETFDHDVIIRPDGSVHNRKKRLSKAVYGTSHTISADELKYSFREDMDILIIGTGQSGLTVLSDTAADYLKNIGCRSLLLPTPQAVETWNRTEGRVSGLFHITC